uniref:Uncharacterized protein n=1 Tax=Fagus sylvatica TaxID=28930 RepID=A0A2N9GDZ3_FAGSY
MRKRNRERYLNLNWAEAEDVDDLGEVVEVDNEGSAVSGSGERASQRGQCREQLEAARSLQAHRSHPPAPLSQRRRRERERESKGEMFDSPTVAGTPSQEQEPHPNTTIAGTSPNHHHRKNTNPTTARTPPNHHHRNNHAPITKFSTSRRGFEEMGFEQSREGK